MKSLNPFKCLALLLAAFVLASCSQKEVEARTDDAVAYTISIQDIVAQTAQVEVRFPAVSGSVVLYMPVWTPGYYVKENFKGKVLELHASDAAGKALAVADAGENRWRVDAPSSGGIVVRYVLLADGRSVSLNEIAGNYAVFNGSATYVTAKGVESLEQRVRLSVPEGWNVATGLKSSEASNHFVAADYEELVDSPILAGDLEILEFESTGTPHVIAYNRGAVEVDNARVVQDLKTMVDATRAFWAEKPWRKYAFLIAFREAGGGLEHRHSTFVNVNPERFATPRGYDAFVSLMAHEYQHAFNVKRLRPFELGPFDYENPPAVSSLWISEGLTSYYSNLMLRRSGLIGVEEYLEVLSRQITALQNSPGRLKQSLEQSSLGVWSNSLSGVNASDDTVSYYIKGEVAGFLLDAHIRHATNGEKSLDDAMRAAYARYSGPTGFRPEEFAAVLEGVVGKPMADWFATVVGSATELDYAEALGWFGLELTQREDGDKTKWSVSASNDADEAQRRRFAEWLGVEGGDAPPVGVQGG
mgnify:CR=1 FL=1